MKYRRLTLDELSGLEKEFTVFLASQTITAPDWQSLKKEKSPKVDALIIQFSEKVFDESLKNVEFLEHRSTKKLKLFKCLADKIIMKGIEITGNNPIDLTQNQSLSFLLQTSEKYGSQMIAVSGQKNYSKEREIELFDMIENGCKILKDSKTYSFLKQMIDSKPSS